MFYGWQVRWKRHVEIFPDSVGLKMLPFPEEIMVMGDGLHTGFRYEFGDGNAQGEIEGDSNGVFRYD